jgi:hypothetical protein
VSDPSSPAMHIGESQHICGLYQTAEERDATLIMYFRTALRAGQACFVGLDGSDSAVRRALGTPREIADWTESGQLQLRNSTTTTAPADGMTFEDIQAVWSRTLTTSRNIHGPGPVRVGGEAAWWISQLREDSFVEYESEMNRYLPENVGMLCLYNLDRFGGEAIIEVVQTHPFLLVSGLALTNPFYLTPENYHATRAGFATDVPTPTQDDIPNLRISENVTTRDAQSVPQTATKAIQETNSRPFCRVPTRVARIHGV